MPNDIKALESLPAVGHKTASVVMSQAFGVPSFPVDTHIHRLMYRWGFSSVEYSTSGIFFFKLFSIIFKNWNFIIKFIYV